MANRRMFSKLVIDTDNFLELPATTQMLYFHFAIRADDDGFIANPKRIMRMVGCGEDDLKLLIHKQFILVFESGVCVIKHWRIHNYIQKDRYTETFHKLEKSMLITDDETNEYKMDTECIQDGYSSDTQVRLGKVRDRLGKDSLEIDKHHVAKAPRYDADNQYYQVALYLRSKILAVNERQKVPKEDPKSMDKWSDAIRKIVELDKRTMDEIKEITEFVFKSDFWDTVIQSPAGLRKHWDKIWGQLIRDRKGPKNSNDYDSFSKMAEDWAGGVEDGQNEIY